jgi:hypothetical protein
MHLFLGSLPFAFPPGRRRTNEALSFVPAILAGCAWLLAYGALAPPAAAQQYVVDDAAIVDRGACQVEAWHGERASWILPACQPIRNLEISAGAGFVDEGGGHRETEYAIEVKTLLRPLAPGGWGVGLVLGVGPNPSAEPGERRFGDVYAFLPASLSLAEDRLVLHGNLGWEWDREAEPHGDHFHERDDHHVTWGARADLALNDLLSVIGEFHGEDDGGPAYQFGFRVHRPAAGVEMDLSWGGHSARGQPGAGFTVGLAFVSGRIF